MDPGVDELVVEGLTLRGVSRGGVMTSIMCPELGVMFDVGGPVSGQQKYDVVLVSHGHQDHLGGLVYFVAQRHMVRRDPPRVLVPIEILEPLEQIFAAWSRIEQFALQVRLEGVAPGQSVELGRGLRATAYRSDHRVPSLAWLIERTTERLRPELGQLPGDELRRLREQGVSLTHTHTVPLLCVTGDTRIELFDREPKIRRARVLVHEVTGWDDRRSVDDVREWGHTHVDELIERVHAFEGSALVLVHRSPRHTRGQAEQVVRDRFPASVGPRVHVFGR